jgi:hypothetical protein
MFGQIVGMEQIMEFIAEQEIAIVRPDNSQQRVTIKIGVPRLGEYRGDRVWECPLKLDGLMEIDNPARGLSSLEAIGSALRGAKGILRNETKGAKIFLVDNLRQVGDLYPSDGVTIKELFE